MSACEENEKRFLCCLCQFSAKYHYYGAKPPFCKSVLLLEDAYIMRDPFSSEGGYITLGSHCMLCMKAVCADQNCSLFYSKRFCMACVQANLDQFPVEIQQELSRKRNKKKV